MSDIQKTIHFLERVPEDISNKISMREISEILSIMFSINDDKQDFQPTVDDFMEALYLRISIAKGLDDVQNGRVYTTEQLLKEIKNGSNMD